MTLYNLNIINEQEKDNFLKGSLSKNDLPEVLSLLVPNITKAYLVTNKIESSAHQLGCHPFQIILGNLTINQYHFIESIYKIGVKYSQTRTHWTKQGIKKAINYIGSFKGKILANNLFEQVDVSNTLRITRKEYFTWWYNQIQNFYNDGNTDLTNFILELSENYHFINLIHYYINEDILTYDDDTTDHDSDDSLNEILSDKIDLYKHAKSKLLRKDKLTIEIIIPVSVKNTEKDLILSKFLDYFKIKFNKCHIHTKADSRAGSKWSIIVKSYENKPINEKIYTGKHKLAENFHIPNELFSLVIKCIYPNWTPEITINRFNEFMNELVSIIYKQGDGIDIEYNENESPFPDDVKLVLYVKNMVLIIMIIYI